MSVKKNYCERVTGDQKKTLLEIMEARPDLAKGKFTPFFTKQNAEECWKDIAGTLNSIPGAVKSWHQWRRCWQDIKKSMKGKLSEAKHYRNQRVILKESEEVVPQGNHKIEEIEAVEISTVDVEMFNEEDLNDIDNKIIYDEDDEFVVNQDSDEDVLETRSFSYKRRASLQTTPSPRRKKPRIAKNSIQRLAEKQIAETRALHNSLREVITQNSQALMELVNLIKEHKTLVETLIEKL